MTAVVHSIREGEYAECIALWKMVWPNNPPGYFERYFFGDQTFQPEYTRVCEQDSRIVSAAHIVKRVVSCGEFTLTMGGIANVATLPEYRGQGLATACLQSAIEIMEADAFDFSLLFAHVQPLYARLGWKCARGKSHVGLIDRRIQHGFSHITVRPYEERDDPALHLLHLSYNASRPITVRRSGPYWRDWIGWWRGATPGKAIIAEEEGAPVGYALYEIGNRFGRPTALREFAVRAGAERALDALLEQVTLDSLSAGCDYVRLPLYSEPSVQEAAARLFSNVEESVYENAMVRFLHRDNLLAGIVPELTERWTQNGLPVGRLVFTNPYGATEIASEGGFLKVSPVEKPLPDALDEAELFDLLIGRGVERLRATEAEAFASALFPQAHPCFWELDGF